jgi:hypothetical protein
MMKYTVIGIYSDNQQPWGNIVEAENPLKAAIKAIKDLYDDGKCGGELEDMFVVDVIEGEHQSVFGTNSGSIMSLEALEEEDKE